MHPASSNTLGISDYQKQQQYPQQQPQHQQQKQQSSVPILKVMRLQSPEFGQPSSGSLDGKCILNSMLTLPDSFGVIHVGETFTAYLGVLNTSHELNVTNLSVSAALQTPSRRFTLSSNLDESKGRMIIEPNKGIDAIVSRVLEEVGQHILRVEVGYGSNGNNSGNGNTSSSNENRKSLRKFYRFNVANPLHIRELTMRCNDISCFVSIAIENVTNNSSLTISGADFHPPHGLVSEMIGGPKCSGELLSQEQKKKNDNNNNNQQPLSSLTLFDNCGRLHPNESFRYLFLIKASSQDAKLRGIAAGDELGKAIFTWKKAMGEAGRIASASVLCPPATTAIIPPPSLSLPGSAAASQPNSNTPILSTYSNTKFVVHGSGLSVDVAASAANKSTNTSSADPAYDSSTNTSTTISLDEVLPITVEPINPPTTMKLGIPTKVQLLVVNHQQEQPSQEQNDKDMNIQIQLRSQHMSGVVICGSSYKNLGSIPSCGGSVVTTVCFVPLVAGLFRVQGCYVVDLISGREIEQPPLFHVFVQKDNVVECCA